MIEEESEWREGEECEFPLVKSAPASGCTSTCIQQTSIVDSNPGTNRISAYEFSVEG